MTETTRHPMTGNEMSGGGTGGMERHSYDVVVIGAGGAGLRAAITEVADDLVVAPVRAELAAYDEVRQGLGRALK